MVWELPFWVKSFDPCALPLEQLGLRMGLKHPLVRPILLHQLIHDAQCHPVSFTEEFRCRIHVRLLDG